jgi:SAM-dependent methyltransferase
MMVERKSFPSEKKLKESGVLIPENAQYFSEHKIRFEHTYNKVIQFAKEGSKVLSVGAGAAFVEVALSLNNKFEVTILDFPEMLELNKSIYDKYNFTKVAADITKAEPSLRPASFDVILFCEIIEHLPTPPNKVFSAYSGFLKPDGLMIITTPNLSRLWTIRELIRKRPISPPPDKTFSIVSFENEGIHRREYLSCEIEHELNIAGLQLLETSFCFFGPSDKAFNFKNIGFFLKSFPFIIIQKLVKGLRPGMCIIAKR